MSICVCAGASLNKTFQKNIQTALPRYSAQSFAQVKRSHSCKIEMLAVLASCTNWSNRAYRMAPFRLLPELILVQSHYPFYSRWNRQTSGLPIFTCRLTLLLPVQSPSQSMSLCSIICWLHRQLYFSIILR